MQRGSVYFPSKGACIYCGTTNVPLMDEHIVPYSLGGGHVLRHASCSTCEDMTKKFEQKVARDLWGDARTSFNAPTRRKRERKSHIVMLDSVEQTRLPLPASEYPAGFVFYKMSKAGILQGVSDSTDLSGAWQPVLIVDKKRCENFFRTNPRNKLVLQFRHVPDDFGRLLAKIGYCQILTMLDLGDFRPICLPYITGEKKNVSYVVGGSLDDQTPDLDRGYSLSTVGLCEQNKLTLVAMVRLYANTHAPAYHVVVGDVSEPAEIHRVIEKIRINSGGIEPLKDEALL